MTRFRSGIAMIALLMPLLLLAASPATAQTPQSSIVDGITTSTIDFPNGITFSTHVDLPGNDPTTGIDLNYRAAPQVTWHLAFVPQSQIVQSGTTLDAEITIDLRNDFLPAGVDLIVFWRIHLRNGETIDTSETRIAWSDPRFTWNVTSTNQIDVHSYALSDAFSSTIANTAQQTIDDLEHRYDLPASPRISIWIYANTTDFRPTTPTNSREAVAGVSYPEYLLISAIIPEGNVPEIDRTITHEISHQVLNQAMQNPYGPPPLWFDEGMATHAQTSGTSGYLPLAIYAATEDQLFELDSLDSGFPFQADKAAIAYAASWAAVEYIEQTWGDAGIARIITGLGEGESVDDVLLDSLGIDLNQLNNQLRMWLLEQAITPEASPTGVQSGSKCCTNATGVPPGRKG